MDRQYIGNVYKFENNTLVAPYETKADGYNCVVLHNKFYDNKTIFLHTFELDSAEIMDFTLNDDGNLVMV